MTDDLFVDAYAISTGRIQRIPRHWLDDPVLGRDFAKTPSQRELDGDLPPRPPGDATAKEIEAFAEAAGLDLSGVKKNADKLVAIEAAFGPGEEQAGMAAVDVEPVAADPLAPELVAHLDQPVEPTAEPVEEPAGAPDPDEGAQP